MNLKNSIKYYAFSNNKIRTIIILLLYMLYLLAVDNQFNILKLIYNTNTDLIELTIWVQICTHAINKIQYNKIYIYKLLCFFAITIKQIC